ncbi:hypothetical protein OKW48_007457 [Paraburkholderia youngii]
MAVGGHCESACRELFVFAFGGLAPDAFARLFQFFGARIAPQAAARTVEHDGRAVGELQRARVDTADRRNAERAREDRDVARRAAGRRAKAEHLAAIERRGIGRRQFLSDQDRLFRHVDLRLLHAGEQREHTAADVADIAGAFAQQRIVELFEHACLVLERIAPRQPRALSLADAADGGVVQVGIVQQFEMRVENLRFRRIGERRLEPLDLLTRLMLRRFELRPFALRRLARFVHLDHLLAELHDLTDRKPRRSGDADEFVGVGGSRLARCRCWRSRRA